MLFFNVSNGSSCYFSMFIFKYITSDNKLNASNVSVFLTGEPSPAENICRLHFSIFSISILNPDADMHWHHLQDNTIPRHQVALADLCLVSIQVPARGPSHLKFQFNRSPMIVLVLILQKEKRKEIEGFETSTRKKEKK